MVGGHFEYKQYIITNIASEIEELINSNQDSSVNEYGDKIGRFFKDNTIDKFKETINYLRKAKIMIDIIDCLLSYDHDEEEFNSEWDKCLNKIKEKI